MSALALAPVAALALVAVAAAALRLGERRQRRSLVGRVVGADGKGPAILFFSGDACTVCHTAQRPALERIAPELQGRVDVREVNVAVERDLARRFGVLSLPTTVLLDADGRALAVNVGFAPATRLRTQLVQHGLIPA